MAIRVGETGKKIYLITNFNMASQTSLQIFAVPPSGEANQKEWTAQLGGALSNITTEGGTQLSVAENFSMVYETSATTDLDEAGDWTLVGVYNNTSVGDILKSAPVTLTVADDFYNAT